MPQRRQKLLDQKTRGKLVHPALGDGALLIMQAH